MLDIGRVNRRLGPRGHEDFRRFVPVPAGAIEEAFRNLGIRLGLAVLDGAAEFLMPCLPPIECDLIDAEHIGHLLVGGTEERKPSAEFGEFRTIQSGCTPADAFADLLCGDASARLGREFINTRRNVLTRPQPVPMSSRLVWGTLVPRCARAFPACKRFREK